MSNQLEVPFYFPERSRRALRVAGERIVRDFIPDYA